MGGCVPPTPPNPGSHPTTLGNPLYPCMGAPVVRKAEKFLHPWGLRSRRVRWATEEDAKIEAK